MAFGDPLVGEPVVITAEDTLAFAGIAPPVLRVYPVVSHIIEKLDALTMPRQRPNTRVRDLPDIALLATTGPIDGGELRRAIEATFSYRATHTVPASVPPPPASWEAPYSAMAGFVREDNFGRVPGHGADFAQDGVPTAVHGYFGRLRHSLSRSLRSPGSR